MTLNAPESSAGVELQKAKQYIRFWRLQVRLEILMLGVVLAFGLSMGAGLLLLDLGKDDITGTWGYPALWAISALRASSVLMPMPGGLTIVGGAIMNPVMGVPAPIVVGLVVGSAESLGEFTGYFAGRNGARLLEGRRLYERIRASIRRRAMLTVLAMSLAPSPVFDVAGIAAGAARMPVRVFYPPLLAGKIVRGIALATAGYYGWDALQGIF
ncbi:MAG: VTT domain-containing protein [Dehalococcoidia bacterium]